MASCAFGLLVAVFFLADASRSAVGQNAEAKTAETDGILYPQDSEAREMKTLDGIWNFRLASRHDPDEGFKNEWFMRPLHETGEVLAMPVPCSYNDVTQNSSIRDHVGWAWYDRLFYVPQRWAMSPQRVVLRFSSAHYTATVWLNGVNVLNHSGGHLPFQAEVTRYLKYSASNLLTVAINNTLTPETIPQGTVQYQNDSKRYPEGYFIQAYSFDFFNYAGIHRPVVLYTTPKLYIDDLTVVTEVANVTTGVVYFKVVTKPDRAVSTNSNCSCYLELSDKLGKVVASSKDCSGKMVVPNASLWWPYTMAHQPGYLYSLKVQIKVQELVADVYRLRIGIRSISWNATSFLVNGKPFYFRGFGKHEDANIRGKGLDLPLVVKDFNLIKWLGANSFRTSHYPYAEEIMDQADEQGIVVIDECPAVALDNFDAPLLQLHLRMMQELVKRDKNRPSVFMWSVANEAKTAKPAAGPYFAQVVNFVKQLDTTRPVTLVSNVDATLDKAAHSVDILSHNFYAGWYSDPGHLEVITRQVTNEFVSWHSTFNKPVLITEYGADTVAGLHTDPPFVFTEDYQVALMEQHFRAFDQLRSRGFFIGEMIWNFADFMTKQEIIRVVGNKKGILTRERQPKTSAHFLRARYWALAKQLDTCAQQPQLLYLITP